MPSILDRNRFAAALTSILEQNHLEPTPERLAAGSDRLGTILDASGALDKTKLIRAYADAANGLTRVRQGRSTGEDVKLLVAVLQAARLCCDDFAIQSSDLERLQQGLQGMTSPVQPQHSAAATLMGNVAYRAKMEPLPPTPALRRETLVTSAVDYIRNVTRDEDPSFVTSGLEDIVDRATDETGEVSTEKLKGLIEAETEAAMALAEAYLDGSRPLPRDIVKDLPVPTRSLQLAINSHAGSAEFRRLAFEHLNGHLPPETTLGVELQALESACAYLVLAEAGSTPIRLSSSHPANGVGALFNVVNGDPALKEYISVKSTSDGVVTIKAKSHDPQKPVVTSVPAALRHANVLRRLVHDMVDCLKRGDESGFDRLLAMWGAQSIENLGMTIEVEGLENLDPNKNYIFAPTHASSFEFPLLCFLLNPWSLGFLAKDAFKKYPLFGTVMSQSDRFFFINRSNRDQAAKTMYAMAEALSNPANSHSQVVYPEGTRSNPEKGPNGERVDPRLGAMKAGIGFLAMDTVAAGNPVEVVPISINGIGTIWPKGFTNPPQLNGKVTVTIGAPINPAQFAGDPEAPKQVVAAVGEALQANYKAGSKVSADKTAIVKKAKRYKVKTSLVDTALTLAGRVPNAISPKIWQMPLAAHNYTQAERIRLGWAHLGPKLQMLWKGLRHVDMFLPDMKPGDRDEAGKAVLRGLMKLASAGTGKGNTLDAKAVENIIPESAKLTPMGRALTAEVIEAYLNKHEVLTLSSVVSARIDEAYGFDPALAREFKEYTLEYLHFIVEDSQKLLELTAKDTPIDETPVRVALGQHVKAAAPVIARRGEYGFAALRDLSEVDLLKAPPTDDVAAAEAFTKLEEAESILGGLLQEGADLSLVQRARAHVAKAYGEYSRVAGLAAGPETFLYLSDPANGQVLTPGVLEEVLSDDVDPALRTRVLEAHSGMLQALQMLDHVNDSQKTQIRELKAEAKKHPAPGVSKKDARHALEARIDALKLQYKGAVKSKVAEVASAEERYQGAMRALLDTPGEARRLQRNLLRYGAVAEALIKDPADLFWEVYSNLYSTEVEHAVYKENDTSNYVNVMREYLMLRGQISAGCKATPDQQKRLDQLFQLATIRVAEFLHSGQGAHFVHRAAAYFGTHIYAKEVGRADCQEALATNRQYWQTRRSWAKAEKSRKEQLVEPIAQFAFERKLAMGHLFIEETDMTLKAAERMMEQAEAAFSKSRKHPKNFAEIKGLYQKALTKFRANASNAVENSPTDQFKAEWEKQLAHIDALLHPGEAEHPHPRELNRIPYNRAVQASAVHAAAAYRMAARLFHQAGLAAKPPRLVGYQAIGVLTKTQPDLTVKGQNRDGHNVRRFMLDGFAPVLRDAVNHVAAGLPTRDVEPAIRRWAQFETFEFHQTKVDDRRSEARVPGSVALLSGDHTGGWFYDYNKSLALGDKSGKSNNAAIIGKGDLELPGLFGQAAPLALRMLPEKVSASAAQAYWTRMLLYGHVVPSTGGGQLARPGSLSTVGYNTASISMMAAPDLNLVADQAGLISAQWRTGMELTGFGRDLGSLLGSAAVYGSLAKVPYLQLEGLYGGLEIGSQPNSDVRINPGQVNVTVADFDPLAIPTGDLVDSTSPFVQVSAHEWNTWYQRQVWVMEESARRLYAKKPEPNGGATKAKPVVAKREPKIHQPAEPVLARVAVAPPRVVAAPIASPIQTTHAASTRLPAALAAFKAHRPLGAGVLQPSKLGALTLLAGPRSIPALRLTGH